MTVIILLESLAYYICIFEILKNIYQLTPESKKSIWILPLFYILFFIANFTVNIDISNEVLLFINLINIISLKCIFKTSKFRSIICIFILLYSINISISSIIKFMINMPSNVLINEAVSISLTIMLLIFCVFVSKSRSLNIQKLFKFIPINTRRITLFSLISSAFLISFIADFDALERTDKWSVFIRLSLLLLIAAVGSAFPIMIANSIAKSFYAKQSKNFEQQIQTQAEYYKVLSKSNYELRKFRHDYKNICIGVSKYIRDGNIKEAEQMLKYCDLSLKQATQSLIKFDTGNGIVDAILTEKQEKATTVNTVITFDGAVATSAIAATDLCVIFGNTLDNAIEACEKLQADEGKTISVICKCSGGFIFLTITNPVAENIEIYNNTILTSKQDKSNHGFGIYSIQKIVDKYNGELTLSCENYLFKTEITLNK